MAKESDASDPEGTLERIAEGAAKILENASDLYNEALLLRSARALSRALTLHQISLEECSKIDMLGAWVSGRLMGYEQPDLERLAKTFANHRAKNYGNAYMIPPDEAEVVARKEGDWGEALNAFKTMQREFHVQSNSAKNASLYVDMKNGEFIAPKDRITGEMVEDIAATNEEFLGRGGLMVRMLSRWSRTPSLAESVLGWIEPRVQEIRSEAENLEEAVAALLDDLMERANSVGYAEAMAGEEERGD